MINFGAMNLDKKIILFDGACNFCAFWVRYVIKRDKNDAFRFSPLASKKGKEYFKKYQIDDSIDTIILIEDNKYYNKSTAALRIIKQLGGIASVWYGLIIIPTFIRNFCYDIIVQHRSKWFGNRKCEFVPHQNTKNKFLM